MARESGKKTPSPVMTIHGVKCLGLKPSSSTTPVRMTRSAAKALASTPASVSSPRSRTMKKKHVGRKVKTSVEASHAPHEEVSQDDPISEDVRSAGTNPNSKSDSDSSKEGGFAIQKRLSAEPSDVNSNSDSDSEKTVSDHDDHNEDDSERISESHADKGKSVVVEDVVPDSSSSEDRVHVPPPPRKSPRTYRGKQVEIPVKAKKAGPSAGKKRKAVSSDEEHIVEPSAETSVPDTVLASAKSVKKRRIPQNVPDVSTDGIWFHSEEYKKKWKFVFHRRIAKERELDAAGLECQEIVNLVDFAGLLKTVKDVGRCYEMLVREFIVNLSEECDNPESDNFRKVYVRGCCVEFSPALINMLLGRNPEPVEDEVITLDEIAKTLTAEKVKEWPKKGLLSAAKLTAKYAVLNRIGSANWVPTNHSSSVSSSLAKLMYLVGTDSRFDFGAHVFESTMRHATSFAVQLPIAFPSLLTELILSQHPDIIMPDEELFKKGLPLTFDYRLFAGPHEPDIALPTNIDLPGSSGTHTVTGSSTEDIVAELNSISKTLQNTIQACKVRKRNVDRLLKMLTAGDANVEHDAPGNGDEEEEEGSDEDSASF